jgi:hypothetical protein
VQDLFAPGLKFSAFALLAVFSHLPETSRFLFMSMSVLLCLSQGRGRRGIDGSAVVDRVVAVRDDAVGGADKSMLPFWFLSARNSSMLSMTVVHLHLSCGHAQKAADQSRRQRRWQQGRRDGHKALHRDDKEGEQTHRQLEKILNNDAALVFNVLLFCLLKHRVAWAKEAYKIWLFLCRQKKSKCVKWQTNWSLEYLNKSAQKYIDSIYVKKC